MASLEEKFNSKLSAGFGDCRISPAIMAVKLTRENRAVQEAALSYLINYVIQMDAKTEIAFELAELHSMCKGLKLSLEELGLTGRVQREPIATPEYLSV